MTTDIKSYRDMLQQPWGKIQYSLTFAQLDHLKNQTILDFGAGFCLTSRHLSQHNTITAIEPNTELLYDTENDDFTKIIGSYDALMALPEENFDTILCHNVLEYIPKADHRKYLAEFERLLKPQGRLSLIKHNQVGKVLQAVIVANDIDTGLDLLNSADFASTTFQQGQTYSIEELLSRTILNLENYLAIRTFYGLQANHVKSEESWLDQLLKMELAVANQKPYKDISFLQHLWLQKTSTGIS